MNRPPGRVARGARRRAILGLALATGLLGGVGTGLGDGSEPRIGLERTGGEAVLTRLPDVLSAEDVRGHLDSGLTSTLALHAVVRDGRSRAEAEGWIAVRYDLWDEIYRVASRGIFGQRSLEISSFDELVRWWRKPRARLPTADLDPESEWQVRLDLDLIPFSSAEERDARRWVAESLRHPERSATDSVSDATESGPEELSNVLNLLLATSVRRRAVASWRWSATLVALPVSDHPTATESPP